MELRRTSHDNAGRLRERWSARIVGGVEVRHGPCESFHENGAPAARGAYHEGEKHGLWEEWHADGTKYAEKTFRRGIAHGRWMNYYLNGVPKCERHFVDGLEHGTRITHYTRGMDWIEEYAGGVKHGLSLELDKAGNIVARRRYRHGVEVPL